jgi:hypothetical protein
VITKKNFVISFSVYASGTSSTGEGRSDCGQQLLAVHAAEVQEASDAGVEVAHRPMRDALPLLDHPILQVLFGDLRRV